VQFAYDATFSVEDLPLRDLDTKIGGLDAELLQRIDQFRLRHDAGAAAGQWAFHPLENLHIPPAPAQHQAGEQPAHRAADDNGAPCARSVADRRRHAFLVARGIAI
jgi:hypothetical protein